MWSALHVFMYFCIHSCMWVQKGFVGHEIMPIIMPGGNFPGAKLV